MAALVLLLPAGLRAGDEDGFLAFWEEHRAAVSNHPAALEACGRYLARTPASAYRPAAAALAAWHALAAGRADDARSGFVALLSAGPAPVAQAAEACARHWLTRLDRESVRGALADWYAAHAAYPASLQPLLALPDDRRPPARDRWGESWEYRLDGFRRLKGLDDQRYRLESRSLGAASDLARALKEPFGRRLNVRAIRIVAGTASPTAELEFTGAAGRHATLMEGTEYAGIRLAKVGARSLLLADGDHWQVLALPAAGGQP